MPESGRGALVLWGALLLVHVAIADPSCGRLLSLELKWPPGLEPRPVELWLPPAYLADSTLSLPILFAQDGQNLFDPARSYSGVDWGLDELLAAPVDSLHPGPAIVVAIGNSPQRRREYMPQGLYDALPPVAQQAFRNAYGGAPLSTLYLTWLAGSLVPAVARQLHQIPAPERSFLVGSSFGGLIALEGALCHPRHFKGAAALSTHWVAGEQGLEKWLDQRFAHPSGQRLYMDHGDQALDAAYPTLQARVNARLDSLGWRRGVDCQALAFPGDSHHESAWRRRVGPALVWLLTPSISH